ncbi:MAG TPA: hypothetical protein VK988_10605 [Acidimicrobiales bacterium]|nr:hypothetical protein [Acidimicrobiales bacterium]
MLSPASPSGLDREEAMALLEEARTPAATGPALLARLERLTGQLQAIVAELETTLD